MRLSTVLAMTAIMAGAPAVIQSDLDASGVYLPLGDATAIMRGDATVMELAQDIAAREFAPTATLTVVDVLPVESRQGVFGERIRPDVGHQLLAVRVHLVNTGKLDLSAHAWQFKAVDDLGREHRALLGNAKDDFAGKRLPFGASQEGLVYFELPRAAKLHAVQWTGDLASATGTWGAER